MIELRGLHLGNIARSPAESVRPDLWPDHAWVPALGCTGGVLYDLCGGKHGSITEYASWGHLDGVLALVSPSSEYLRAPVVISGEGALWGAQGSMFLSLHHTTPTNSASPIGWVPPKSSRGGIVLHGTTEIRVYDEGGHHDLDWDNLGMPAGAHDLAIVRSVSTPWAAWLDGAIDTDPDTPIGTFDVQITKLLGGYNSFVGAVYCAHIYSNRPLMPAQVLDFTADPLLPFRRRQPVYYSVPSGGGASLAASSAWRVFTARAIDTAWAIRAALAGSTAWAVLTQSGAATSWRIAAASDADTGWRIATDLQAPSAWRVFAESGSPAAWNILTASEADTAWRIATDLNASTAWAILTSLDAATAWAIISAGTLLANTGWAIRTEADTDTGWHIKADTAADTAWAVRNARDAATAWDIQAALAGATAWRITTDLQADTAWTVITDMDADAAWRILRADQADTGWLVFDAIEADTGWVVLSDIIPVAVRTFLAQDRPFMINAARRLLIITKKRP